MIERAAITTVHELSAQFPAVLILGPRQCGKTTLAKNSLQGEYFDLEKPSDQDLFAHDSELALNSFRGPLIIDEAQTLPHIFPVIRSAIDAARNRKGMFYLLGSVNPALVRHISESLAGRVGILELTPFLFEETASLAIDLQDYWLRGGYPDAVREKEKRWQRWQENYIRTFIERDIPRHGISISPVQIRRLMGMIAHYHGGLLNLSDFGRSLGISYHTINNYLDILEAHFLIRRLHPFHLNIGKRLVKSPKIYIRDTGVLHYLLGISTQRQLLESPKRGNSWEGLLIEQLIAREQLQNIGSQFFFYRTHAGAEIDLIIQRGEERIGYEFKCSRSVTAKDLLNLKSGLADGIIDRAVVVCMGARDYQAAENITVVEATRYLCDTG